MDQSRILIIVRAQRSSQLINQTQDPKQLDGLRREAAIWNIATCLVKGKLEQAPLHAPIESRSLYLAEAKRRILNVQEWVRRHQMEAEETCAPIIKEYAERAERRKKLAVA